MKVLHLISGGEQGGSKTHVLSLLEELQKHITVNLALLLNGDFYQEALQRGLSVQVFKRQKRYHPGVAVELYTIVKEGGYTLLHCHGPRANFNAFLLRRFYKIPCVTTMHSDYLQDFKNNAYKNFVYTALNAVSLRSFDRYIVVSKDLQNMLVSRGFAKKSTYVVYNGIDFNAPLQFTGRQEYFKRKQLNIPPEAKVIGILARLHPIKGHTVFMEGARRIVDKRPDTHFLIAGDGEEKAKLMQLRSKLHLGNNLHFIGHVNNPDEFLQAVDINALTSYSETFPYCLLEGARARRPTVSTAVGGIPNLIIEGKTGYLFQPGNSREFSEKVLTLLGSKESERIGENLYTHAKENFSLENLAASHLRIYADHSK